MDEEPMVKKRMFRILLLEDVPEIFEYFLRFFENLLPMDQIELTHAETLEEAASHLGSPWDIILVDYQMGAPYRLEGLKSALRSGADFLLWRRIFESTQYRPSPAYVIATSSSGAANQLLKARGANAMYLKLQVEEIARAIAARMAALNKPAAKAAATGGGD